MNVQRVMTTDVATCEPGQTLDAVVRTMEERDCGALPVVDDGRVVGMVTDRDVVLAAVRSERPLGQMSVADAMTRDPVTCRPDDPVPAAQSHMREAQVRRLPVVDGDGRLAGVLTLGGLAHATRQEPLITRAEVGATLAAIVDPDPPRRI